MVSLLQFEPYQYIISPLDLRKFDHEQNKKPIRIIDQNYPKPQKRPTSVPLKQNYLNLVKETNQMGRTYCPGRALSMTEREKILELYEKGYKISHIAKMIGVTHSCVSKIMTRYRRTGSMYPRTLARITSSPASTSSEEDTEDKTLEEPLEPSPTTPALLSQPRILSHSIERLLSL